MWANKALHTDDLASNLQQFYGGSSDARLGSGTTMGEPLREPLGGNRIDMGLDTPAVTQGRANTGLM